MLNILKNMSYRIQNRNMLNKLKKITADTKVSAVIVFMGINFAGYFTIAMFSHFKILQIDN